MDPEFTANTLPILNKCLLLLEQTPVPCTAKYAPAFRGEKYRSHPDIQFFSSIKKKHHFEYHRQKQKQLLEPVYGHVKEVTGSFDPYSRKHLLQRIGTYNALNWSIPPSASCHLEDGEEITCAKSTEHEWTSDGLTPSNLDRSIEDARSNPGPRSLLPIALTELFCAANGWACKVISRDNNFTNHLKCTACSATFILRFNSVNEANYSDSLLDMDDIAELNDNLKVSYLSEIRQGAHSASCPWKIFLCSLQGTYYLTPFVASTISTLISEYLECLKNLVDNLSILEHMEDFCSKLIPPTAPRTDTEFVRVSKIWFLNRFYPDTKDNFAAVLDFMCPPWIYKVAAQGWKLSLQKHQENILNLIKCDFCNQRLFVDCILAEEGLENYWHKKWCTRATPMGDMSFHEHFCRLVVMLEKLIGAHGEYLLDQELSFDIEAVDRKRWESFDVNEGLERFKKLRKMYFN